jgi:hypothetical protein
MSQLDPLKAYTAMKLGQRVDRDTANLTTGLNLFTVTGGRVLVTQILGEVTTIIETKTVNLKLTADPTTGTTNDLCANLDMTASEVGSLLSITGTVGDPLIKGSSGAVKGQLAPVVVAVGAIEATVGDTHTGSIKWSLWYVPLDDGAYVTVA